MKRLQQLLATALLAALMLGCATLGMAPLDTFEKRVAGANTTVQVIAESAANGLASGALREKDAANVVVTMRASLQAIQVAQEIYYGACPLRPTVETPDPACTVPAADAKLKATLAILTALQAYLATQGVK